jgi:hypothetical protein
VLTGRIHCAGHFFTGTLRHFMGILPSIESAKECDVTVEKCISQSIHFRLHTCFRKKKNPCAEYLVAITFHVFVISQNTKIVY